MKKFKLAVLALAAALAVAPVSACRNNTKKVTSVPDNNPGAYADISDVGKNKVEVSISEDAEVNDTAFKLNRVIDSGRVKDGLKYIYLDVTIKNSSSDNYDLSGLNNFYLILKDGTEVLTDVRADIYAKQSMKGYEHLEQVAAGAEFTGYIGFTLDESIEEFTACFFPTGTDDDKTNVVRCEVKAGDIVAAPEGMFKAS